MLRDFIPTLASAALCVLVAGCSGSSAGGVDLGVDPLLDVNQSSATHDQPVHPNDYRGKVSAWYFGHAT